MSDPHYPKVDFDFYYQLVCSSDKIETQEQFGNIIAILLIGTAPVHKRTILLRKSQGGVLGYEQATAVALRLGFLTELMDWYKDNKSWKDGGYFEPQGA